MALHDWVDIPPFTDLASLKKAHSFKFRLIGSIVNPDFRAFACVVGSIYLVILIKM
jgi:hypothetical protein